MTRVRRLWTCGSLALLVLGCAPPARPAEFVFVTDIEGTLFPRVSGDAKVGGTGLLSSAIKRLESGAEAPLLIAGGNSLFGTPEAFFTRGKAVMDALEAFGADAFLIGHREFYFGQERLATFARQASFPLVCGNVANSATGERPSYLAPYAYFPETRMGVIGVVGYKFEQTNVPQDIEGLSRIDPSTALPPLVKELRDKGARIVAVGGDLLWNPDASPDDPDSALLASVLSVPGVDLVLARAAKSMEGFGPVELGAEAVIVAAKTKGEEAALVSVRDGTLYFALQRADSTSLDPDPAMAASMTDLERTFSELSTSVVGTADGDIPHDFKAESPLGNLVCDILRAYAGTDVFVRNSGSIREGFKAGPITRLDLYKVQPWEGVIAVTSLTGAQLVTILESSVAFKLDKSFLQVSGLSFAYDPSKPVFSRVVPGSVRVGGEPLDPERRYSLGSTDYVILGGDGYEEFPRMGITIERKLSRPLRAVVEEAIRAAGTIRARVEGRAKVAGK